MSNYLTLGLFRSAEFQGNPRRMISKCLKYKRLCFPCIALARGLLIICQAALETNSYYREFKMTNLRKLLIAVAVAAIGAGASIAQAAPTLSISAGGPATLVADGDPGDATAALGAVTFIGSVGVWTVNIDTGITKPVLGSATFPHMDLNFIDVSSAAGVLTLMFSDTDFAGPTSGLLQGFIGGTTPVAGTTGTVEYRVYADASNALFGMGTLVGSGTYTAAAYSGSFNGAFAAAGPYSITQWIQITHRGAGATSGDAVVIPEPMSLALLGLGLAGLGLVRRRRAA